MSRLRRHFRDRMPEWTQSVGMLLWGLIAFFSIGVFEDQHFFHPLLILMSQEKWAIAAIVVGAIRLTFLFINGAWRPSAHIRAIGCVMGVLLWGSLLISSLSLAWLTPTVTVYAMLLVFDLFSLWFASGDAKLADIAARKR